MLLQESYKDSFDIPLTFSDNRWYLNLPRTGSEYFIDLIGRAKKKEKILCRSNTIRSPRATIAGILEKKTIMDSKNDILALSGLYDVGDSLRNEIIPQRIISLMDAKNFSFK